MNVITNTQYQHTKAQEQQLKQAWDKGLINSGHLVSKATDWLFVLNKIGAGVLNVPLCGPVVGIVDSQNILAGLVNQYWLHLGKVAAKNPSEHPMSHWDQFQSTLGFMGDFACTVADLQDSIHDQYLSIWTNKKRGVAGAEELLEAFQSHQLWEIVDAMSNALPKLKDKGYSKHLWQVYRVAREDFFREYIATEPLEFPEGMIDPGRLLNSLREEWVDIILQELEFLGSENPKSSDVKHP